MNCNSDNCVGSERFDKVYHDVSLGPEQYCAGPSRCSCFVNQHTTISKPVRLGNEEPYLGHTGYEPNHWNSPSINYSSTNEDVSASKHSLIRQYANFNHVNYPSIEQSDQLYQSSKTNGHFNYIEQPTTKSHYGNSCSNECEQSNLESNLSLSSSMITPTNNSLKTSSVTNSSHESASVTMLVTDNLMHEEQVLNDSHLSSTTNIQSASTASAIGHSQVSCKLPSDVSRTATETTASTVLDVIDSQDKQPSRFYSFSSNNDQSIDISQQLSTNGTMQQYDNNSGNNVVIHHHHQQHRQENRFPLIAESHSNANIVDGNPHYNTTIQQQAYNSSSNVDLSANFIAYPTVSPYATTDDSFGGKVDPSIQQLNGQNNGNDNTYYNLNFQQSHHPTIGDQVGVFSTDRQQQQQQSNGSSSNKFSATFEHHSSSSSPIKFSSSSLSQQATQSTYSYDSIMNGNENDRVSTQTNDWAATANSADVVGLSSPLVTVMGSNKISSDSMRNELYQHYEHYAQSNYDRFQKQQVVSNSMDHHQPALIKYDHDTGAINSSSFSQQQQQSVDGHDYILARPNENNQQAISASYHQGSFNQATPAQFSITY